MLLNVLGKLTRVTLYLAFSVVLLLHAANWLFAQIDRNPQPLLRWLSEQAVADITLSNLQVDWRVWGSVIRLEHLKLYGHGFDHPAIVVNELAIDVDIWQSLLLRKLVTRQLQVSDMTVCTEQHEAAWQLCGFQLQGKANDNWRSQWSWLLAQYHLQLNNIDFVIRDNNSADKLPQKILTLKQLWADRTLSGYEAQASLAGFNSDSIDITILFEGSPIDLDSNGRLYMQATDLQLAQLPKVFLPAGLQQLEGDFNTQFWAEWRNGYWDSGIWDVALLDGELIVDNQANDTDNKHYNLDAAVGRLLWLQDGKDSWQLISQNWSLIWQGQHLPEFQFQLRAIRDSHDIYRYEAIIDQFALDQLVGIVPFIPDIEPSWQHMVQQAQPGGRLHNVRLLLRNDPKLGYDFSVSLGFSDIHFRSFAGGPALSIAEDGALSGWLFWENEQGHVDLIANDIVIDFHPLFREPTAFKQLYLNGDWELADDTIRLRLPILRANNNDVESIQGMLKLEIPMVEDKATEFSLYAELENANAARKSAYLPVAIMSDGLVDYLDNAVISGDLTFAHIAMRGSASAFPYHNVSDFSEGIFDIYGHIENAQFEYYDHWPVARDVQAELHFLGDAMTIDAHQGKVYDSRLQYARATIPVLSADVPQLTIHAEVDANSKDGLRLMQESPLRDILDLQLEHVAVNGKADVDLTLEIPLTDDEDYPLDTRVNGFAKLYNNTVSFTDVNIDLKQLNGQIDFSDNSLSAQKVTGRLFDQAFDMRIKQRETGAAAITDFIIDSSMPVKRLGDIVQTPLWEQFSGRSDYQIVYSTIEYPDNTTEDKLTITSDLQGVAIDLPEPFAKKSAQAKDLAITLVQTSEQQLDTTANYDEMIFWRGQWQAKPSSTSKQKAFQLAKGAIALGQVSKKSLQPGLQIYAQLPQIHLAPWSTIVTKLVQNGDHNNVTTLSAVDINVEHINAWDIPLDKVNISLAKQSTGRFHIKAEQVQGNVAWVRADENNSQPHLLMDLQKIILPSRSDDLATKPSAIDPASLPALQFFCAYCQLGEHIINNIRVETEPANTGLKFIGNLGDPLLNGDFRGQWLGLQSGALTRIQANLRTPNIENLMRQWRHDVGIKAKDGDLEGELSTQLTWPGDPSQWDWGTAWGKLSFDVDGAGYLEDVSDKPIRLFSLLNLQSLKRRLFLDFEDIYKDGLHFDGIKGEFELASGIASTDNTTIDGVAADIEISGRTDMVNETFDQQVVVTPELSTGLPIAAAVGWAVNPPAAAVALVLQQLIEKPLEVITSVEYRVSGKWDDPQLIQIGKTQGLFKYDDKKEKK